MQVMVFSSRNRALVRLFPQVYQVSSSVLYDRIMRVCCLILASASELGGKKRSLGDRGAGACMRAQCER